MNSMAARAFIGLLLTGYAADFCDFDGTINDIRPTAGIEKE
jgi:hypothetical protein